MTITQKLEQYITDIESKNCNIPTESSTRILQGYYHSLGVAQTTSFTDWMYGVAKGKYPPYGSVTRAIRKCRSANPKWRKTRKTVDSQVTTVKKEVGY